MNETTSGVTIGSSSDEFIKSSIAQRDALIKKIIVLIRDEMQEEGKKLTIIYTRGVLEEAIKDLDCLAGYLPVEEIIRRF